MFEKLGIDTSIKKLQGSMAIGYLQTQKKIFTLLSTSNPITLAYVKEMDSFVFASTTDILLNSLTSGIEKPYYNLLMTEQINYPMIEFNPYDRIYFNFNTKSVKKQKISVPIVIEHKIDKEKWWNNWRNKTPQEQTIEQEGRNSIYEGLDDIENQMQNDFEHTFDIKRGI